MTAAGIGDNVFNGKWDTILRDAGVEPTHKNVEYIRRRWRRWSDFTKYSFSLVAEYGLRYDEEG